MAEHNRLIKKYPNRRLYDTRTSTYITLAEIKKLVLAHEDIRVVDAKSDEDLTRATLLQVILEEEAGVAPMFSPELLSQMIRFYGNAMQGLMGNYIENNIKSFSEVQAKLKGQAKVLDGEDTGASQDLWAQFLKFQAPAMQHMMGTYVEQSQKMFQRMQDTMQEQTRQILSGGYVKSEETAEKK
jgi:polyhydroxyalkanoate synthesis repressor PhaR